MNSKLKRVTILNICGSIPGVFIISGIVGSILGILDLYKKHSSFNALNLARRVSEIFGLGMILWIVDVGFYLYREHLNSKTSYREI